MHTYFSGAKYYYENEINFGICYLSKRMKGLVYNKRGPFGPLFYILIDQAKIILPASFCG